MLYSLEMARLLSFIVLSVLPWLQLAQGQAFPFCQANTDKYDGPKLPSLPNAFTAQRAATIVNRNYSMLLTEYYDKDANKGAIRRVKNGQSTYVIYNYNENEMMAMNLKFKNCTVQDINTMHGHPSFGRNSSKIEGIADLFRFGAKFNETYLGNTTVRGIPCFHWQACINLEHHSYLIDYFFSIPGWSMPNSRDMQVVRATVNGTSFYFGNQSLPNKTHSFHHIYDFFSFNAAKPDPHVFMVPNGIFCEGMKDKKPLPKMPLVFSLEIETVIPNTKTIMQLKEYYDFDRKLVMFQYYDYRHKGYGETRIIHDFQHGVKYNISGFVCQNATRLTKKNTPWDGKETKGHHLEMMNPTEMMFLHANKSAVVYVGSANVRGIEADVWMFKRKSVYSKIEMTSQYYFSKPQWNMRAGSLKNQSQVLLKIDAYGPNMTLVSSMNILNFDGELVPLHVFSIAPCFTGEKNIISLKFPGDWKKMVYKQEMQFNLAVRNAIAQSSKISPLRVDSLKNGQGDNSIMVWFTLLGRPPVHAPDHENDLKTALDALKKKVMAGDLVITWKNPVTAKLMKVIADKDYFYNSMVTPTKKPKGGKGDKRPMKKGVPTGAVVGVAFLMIAVGVLIGLAIAHFMMKRRGDSLFRYQRQE